MKPSLNLPSHFDRLPIDLFIPILLLSFNTQEPALKLARTEQLRLVNRAWQTAIDATAPFWTCIPNEPRSTLENVRRWIKNSGELPLHIMCNYQFIPSGGFMQLITPLAYRWHKMELDAGYCSISTYIEKPVPLLEVFDLSSACISPDLIFFGGVHPVLSDVRLSDVVLPNDTGFLRNIKVLCLKLISSPSGKLRLSGLRAILAESPHLEQLVLDAHYLNDMEPPPPILLPYLTSFQLIASMHPPRCPAAISAMIHAPNVTHLDLCFDDTPVPEDLNLGSTLAGELLRQPSSLAIEIFPWGFNLSTEIQPEAPCVSQGLVVAISRYTRDTEVAVSLLRYIGSITSPLVPIDLVVHEEAMEEVFNYLKSSQEVEVGYHLPGLRTVSLDSLLLDSYPYKQIVADLARARDIIIINLRARNRFGSDQRFLK